MRCSKYIIQKASRFLFVTVVAMVLCAATSKAQVIKLVRTDVDSGRSHFVTTTKSFGVDVIVDSIANCTGVSFELRYTNPEYAQYSNAKGTSFSPTKDNWFVINSSRGGTIGSLTCGALSGVKVGEAGFTNPRVIHLDFVVNSNTPNNTPIVFTFANPQAVVSDSGGRIISLNSIPYSVTTHGFIDVYPGDANNDGVVDSKDASQVGAYVGIGLGNTLNVRGYKRETASTMWIPQKSLVWDSAAATYADCDGNGYVTVGDNLVIPLNIGKQHNKTHKGDTPLQSNEETSFPYDATKIPLRLQYAQALMGISLTAQCNGATILGFQPNKQSASWFSSYTVSKDSTALLLCSSSQQQENLLQSGVVGWIVCKQTPLQPHLEILQAYGLTANGDIFELQQQAITSVDEIEKANSWRVHPNPAHSVATLNIPQPNTYALSLYSVLGELQFTMQVEPTASSVALPIESLSAGHYHAVLTSPSEKRTIPFSVVR